MGVVMTHTETIGRLREEWAALALVMRIWLHGPVVKQ